MTKEKDDEEASLAAEMARKYATMIEAMSNEQVWEIRQAFSHFDKDNRGSIGTKELGSLFKALGQNLSDEELLTIIIQVDVDSKANCLFLFNPQGNWLVLF